MESRLMAPGEIWLARFPLAGSGGTKLRPVLLLSDLTGPVPEILTGYISSVVPSLLLPSDLVLDPSQPEFASTNLKTVSVLRLHKLATVHRRDVVRQLGVLSPAALLEVQVRLRVFLNL
jgi:mRNA interferase MazF